MSFCERGGRRSRSAMPHLGASPHWERTWSAGLPKGTKFDVGAPSATLLAALATNAYAGKPQCTALVPGCGRAYDALALAAHGFDRVVACDLAPTACDAARAEVAAAPDAAIAARVDVVCADFFEPTELAGTYDLIWDYTFLCALDPSVRAQWAERTASLLAPDGALLTCIFPIAPGKVGGPPYALDFDLVRGLLEPVGLRAVEVRDPMPPEAAHAPGGVAGSGFGTALAVWRR